MKASPELSIEPVLIAFGPLKEFNPSLTSDRIFADLVKKHNAWLTQTRQCLIPGADLLFYQKGKGFVGLSQIDEVSLTQPDDAGLCPGIPVQLFPQRLVLLNTRIFFVPIDCRPLINDLTFISNKTHWGLSFMNTPKTIPVRDLATVLNAAAKMTQSSI